jgi:hypothetical protein
MERGDKKRGRVGMEGNGAWPHEQQHISTGDTNPSCHGCCETVGETGETRESHDRNAKHECGRVFFLPRGSTGIGVRRLVAILAHITPKREPRIGGEEETRSSSPTRIGLGSLQGFGHPKESLVPLRLHLDRREEIKSHSIQF